MSPVQELLQICFWSEGSSSDTSCRAQLSSDIGRRISPLVASAITSQSQYNLVSGTGWAGIDYCGYYRFCTSIYPKIYCHAMMFVPRVGLATWESCEDDHFQSMITILSKWVVNFSLFVVNHDYHHCGLWPNHAFRVCYVFTVCICISILSHCRYDKMYCSAKQ